MNQVSRNVCTMRRFMASECIVQLYKKWIATQTQTSKHANGQNGKSLNRNEISSRYLKADSYPTHSQLAKWPHWIDKWEIWDWNTTLCDDDVVYIGKKKKTKKKTFTKQMLNQMLYIIIVKVSVYYYVRCAVVRPDYCVSLESTMINKLRKKQF